MKLLIDFGNSRCKWAQLDNGRLQSSRAQTYVGNDVREKVENIITVLPVMECEQIHVVSVLGAEFDRQFAQHVAAVSNAPVTQYESLRDAFGIRLAYTDPGSYGADRYAALVAAYHSGRGSKIIVDCGTAVTVDAIDSGGKHLGGLIMPGVELMCSMLAEKASGISETNTQISVEYLNATTHDAVVSGSTLCLRHGLHSIIATMQKKLDQNVSIFATGGARAALLELKQDQYIERPDLVLEGLQIMQSN